MNEILNWAMKTSKQTLERLDIRENALIRIPTQISFFGRLSHLDLSGNIFPVISNGSLIFSSLIHTTLINDCSVEVIEPGAIQGI